MNDNRTLYFRKGDREKKEKETGRDNDGGGEGKRIGLTARDGKVQKEQGVKVRD